MKLYIAGPMSGYPDYNYPAFHKAESDLKIAGYEVASPACIPGALDMSYYECLRAGLHMMLDCDGIALLEGWEDSRGATLECDLGRMLAWDFPIEDINYWIDKAKADV